MIRGVIKTTLQRLSAALAAPLLLLGACQTFQPGSKVIETRAVSSFDRIEAQGSTRLHVQVGAPLGLTVLAPEDSIAEVVTEVRDGVLIIREADGSSDWWDSGNVAVTVPSLAWLHVSGSADASLEGFTGGQFEVLVSGSGDVKARGRVDRVEASVSGAGDLDLRRLEADEVAVRVEGSGDAVVWAVSAVDVSVFGSGHVRVKGRPSVSRVSTEGAGGVSQD